MKNQSTRNNIQSRMKTINKIQSFGTYKNSKKEKKRKNRNKECRAVSRASWKIMLAPMTGNVVIPEVDALTYIVLSEVEKHVSYRELADTRECLTLHPRCVTNRGRYNLVQPYTHILFGFSR
jgi:hypothetical protein